MEEDCRSKMILFNLTIVTLTTGTLFVVISSVVLNSSAACISYNSTTRTVTVSCTSATRLTDVNNVIHNSAILKKESNGIWILSSNIVVAKYGNFVIDSTDTSWLKIISSSTTAYGLKNYGSLKIDSVKITSWNVGTNTYASTSSDGKTPRAYIVAKSGATGKMNILNSEIAYLGRDVSGEHGLDYYGSGGSLLQNNNIHHNWRAFYSAGVGGLTFTKNVVHDNLQYGIDPHSGTHDMYITYNKAYNNNHGIICSVMCYNIHIQNNELYNNKRDGIFLDAGSHHITIANNKIYNEDEAIQLPSLSYSEVYGNTITDSNYGIVMYTQIGSTFDRDDRCGTIGCVSIKNNIHDNNIKASNTGIVLKGGASSNIIESNTMNGPNAQYGIKVDGSKTSSNLFRYNHIANSDYGVLLSGENKDSKFKRNYFDSVVPSGEYTLRGSSALKLEETKFYSDVIKAVDTTSNTVSISRSGVISVTDSSTGQTTKHYTDSQTYSKTLKNSAMIKVNTISSTTLSTSAISLTVIPASTSVPDNSSSNDVSTPSTSPSSVFTANPDESISRRSSTQDISPRDQNNRTNLSTLAQARGEAQHEAEKSLTENKFIVESKSDVFSKPLLPKNEQKPSNEQKEQLKDDSINDNFAINHLAAKKVSNTKPSDQNDQRTDTSTKSQEGRVKHDTILTLSLIHDGADGTYILKGKLWDNSFKVPLHGKKIFLSGDPSIELTNQVTNHMGNFEKVLDPPDKTGIYRIQAHFAEDDHYHGAHSNTVILRTGDHKSTPESGTVDFQAQDQARRNDIEITNSSHSIRQGD